MDYRITIFFAELAIKGENRQSFIKRLRQNVSMRLRALGLIWVVSSLHDRLFVKPINSDDITIQQVAQQLAILPGIARITIGYWFCATENSFFSDTVNLDSVEKKIIEIANSEYLQGSTFAVRVKRGDKRFPVMSHVLEKRMAHVIHQNSAWEHVDLKYPDQLFNINIASTGITLEVKNIEGTGGLPVSTTGRVLVLLSGGFDSPVAAFLMANRGCNIDCIHFTPRHFNAAEIEENKIVKITQKMSEFAGKVRLLLLPYTHFDLAMSALETAYDLMLFRRFMANVAEKYMQNTHIQALVTGDNLGQVASQTLTNIVSFDAAVDVPVFRPLLTFNKEDIIALNRKLGLYDLCNQPYKDCCALMKSQPKTRSRDYVLDKIESQEIPQYQQLIDQTLSDRTELVFQFGQLIKSVQPEV